MTNYGFILTAILAAVFLILAAIFISIAYISAGGVEKDNVGTQNYKNASSVRTYLLIAVLIGWLFIIILLTDIGVSFATGTYNIPAMKNFFKKKTLNEKELLDFVNDVEETSDIKRNLIINFIALFLTVIAAFIIAILGILASFSVGSISSKSTPSTQSKSLIAGLIAFAAVAMAITSMYFLKKEYSSLSELSQETDKYIKENIGMEKVKTTEKKLQNDKELQKQVKSEADAIKDAKTPPPIPPKPIKIAV
jgi:hypothetical protein